eukprot:1849612-Rhodomonas_salina.1
MGHSASLPRPASPPRRAATAPALFAALQRKSRVRTHALQINHESGRQLGVRQCNGHKVTCSHGNKVTGTLF